MANTDARLLYEAGQYQKAALAFGSLGDYKNAKERYKPLFRMFSNRLSAADDHTIALKADGTVVATGTNSYKQCELSSWTDIVAIAAGENYTVGLKADGTVVAVGSNDLGQCDVSDWTNIGMPTQTR